MAKKSKPKTYDGTVNADSRDFLKKPAVKTSKSKPAPKPKKKG